MHENSSFIKSKSFYVKIIILILAIIYFVKTFVPIGITILDADGKGTYVDQFHQDTVMVGTDGNGYIRTEFFVDILGTDKPEQYNKLIQNPFRNMNNDSFFLKIYDGGDAERMHISFGGGTIITKSGDLYIFSNEYEKYITPALFMHNIKDAFIWHDKVYVINSNDELGYYKISDKEKFIPICKNVRSFQIDEISESDMLVLTNDNVLYVYSKSDNEYEKMKLREDVKSFSFAQDSHGTGSLSPARDYNMLGLITTDGQALYTCTDALYHESEYSPILKLADFQNAEFALYNENAVDIAVYDNGAAVLIENGNVYVTSAEPNAQTPGIDYKIRETPNVLVAKNIKSIKSDANHVLTLDNDGTLICYGTNPDQSNIGFVALSEDDK